MLRKTASRRHTKTAKGSTSAVRSHSFLTPACPTVKITLQASVSLLQVEANSQFGIIIPAPLCMPVLYLSLP